MKERTDQDLLSWVIEHASGYGRAPRWSFVGQLFGLGSTSAIALCERFGHNPHTARGSFDCPCEIDTCIHRGMGDEDGR